MNEDLRVRADANITAATARLGLADPRPAFRDRLRFLKDDHPEAFKTALAHYETVVLPAISSEGDVMEAWIQYGSALAALTATGRMVRVDPTGLATRYSSPLVAGELVLHVPDENAAPVLIAAAPASPTQAQQATIDLLVKGSLGLRPAPRGD